MFRLASKGVKPAGAPLWRYLVIDMAAKLEIDVGVPVATTLTDDNRITADPLPAGRYATLIYTGPYEGLMQATADLLARADKKGRSRTRRNGKQSWPSSCRMIKGWVEKRTILVLSFPAYECNQEKWIDWAGCGGACHHGDGSRIKALRMRVAPGTAVGLKRATKSSN